MKKWLVMAVLALTACGGGSSSSEGKFTSGGGNSAVIGVWDATVDEGVDGVDEAYIVIDEDGDVTVYDYAGDSYDNGNNCYWIETVDHLDALGNNRYDSLVYDDLLITVSGNTMTLTGLDDGESFTESYIRSSLKVSDLTPECSESFENSRALIPAKKTKISTASYIRK